MANQVIGLDVEIKVANALAELRKLSPGADKEAKAIAGSLSKALKDAEKQAQKTGAAMKEVSVRTSSVSDKAGVAGANVQKLAGALSMVNPAAAGVAGNIADMADVVEVAGVASEALGVSLASIATIAAPVALAIGALYLAYREYNAELQVSLDKEAESARQMGIHGDLSSKVKADREALAIATGTLNQATVDANAIEADYATRLDKTTAADKARIRGLALLGTSARPEDAATRALREAAIVLFEQGRMAEVLQANLPLAFDASRAADTELHQTYLDMIGRAGAAQLVAQKF